MKKSEHHDIDAVFRQHFEAAAVPLENADALWGRIANEQKKNRYGLWIWFLGTALALLLVTLAYMPYHKGITSGHKAIIVDSAQTNSFSQLSESSVSSSINQSTNEKASVSSSSIVSAASNTNPENNKAIPIPLESGVESESDSDSDS
ncbi:MAG: hypothetical protein KJP00_08490, partial [Bacteroidia bacterium]|nr:hypothetical protein [Bacteroidia bacterium]